MYVEAVVWWGTCCLLLQGGVWAGSCPPRCVCQPQTKDVNCSGKHLAAVPDGVPTDTRRLDLSRNKLKTLGRRAFSGLGQVTELDLRDNVLSMIEVEAFAGLHNLRTLYLRSNRLKILPVGMFSGLSNLRFLDLAENELLVFLDFTFREAVNLQRMEAGKNDLVFISQRAFSGLQNLQELNLDRSNLTFLPTEALSQLQSLTRLRMLRLVITALPNNAFRRLQRLRSLFISQWPSLDTLASNSLIGLNLTSLVISGCNLSAVPYTALRHLVYLRYLDLSYNPITTIQGNMLGDLLRLQELHLAGASLLRIEPGAFRGLAVFRTLNVSDNQLATLEEGAFHSVGNLQVLRLDANPLACDCRLLWVVRRRFRLDFDSRQPACLSPDTVRAREFQGFSEKELTRVFTCRPARIVERHPQETTVEEGTTVLFSCLADGDPAPTISWRSPTKTLLSTAGRVRVLADGNLEVRYTRVQDSGTYRCTASNAAGNETATISLQVRGFPGNRTAMRLFGNDDDAWLETSQPTANASMQVPRPYPFDAKTLIIATTMGFLSFLSSVAVCFVFMFFWSQSKGQVKHAATIDFVPRSSIGGGGGESGRFTMKLI